MSFFRFLLLLCLLAVSALILAGFGGALHPALDTISNFRLHLSVLLAGLALLWTFRCSRIPAIGFAIIALIGLVGSRTGLPQTQFANQTNAGQKVYKAFVMNLLWNNSEQEAVLSLIARHKPDLLLLTEVSRGWRANLEKLEPEYPYRFNCAEWRTIGGSVIFSRHPVTAEKFCGPYASLGLATITLDGVAVDTGVVHLRWPWPASGPRQISEITPVLQELGDHALVAGDFNSATWTHSVDRFARAGNLSVARGIGATWSPTIGPGTMRFRWPVRLGLPIDNVMSKGNVGIVSARSLEFAGSDHLPILVEFIIGK
ncbi:MAG: endonuclease/exonuclease/phosphatase family protein [Rhizobiaceae bacterium]